MPQAPDAGIPILTDVVGVAPSPEWPSAAESLIAELQTRLAAESFALAEGIVRQAFAEMEAGLLEQITARLRKELPELIDSILRRQLEADPSLGWQGRAGGAGTEDSEG